MIPGAKKKILMKNDNNTTFGTSLKKRNFAPC